MIFARTNYATVPIDVGAIDTLWQSHGKHMGVGASIGVVMDPLGGGFRVQKHTIVDGACFPVDCSSGERAEVLNSSHFYTPNGGGRLQMGFRLYLPSDFQASSSAWNYLCQTHYNGSIQQSPWAMSILNQGDVYFVSRGGPLNSEGTMGTIINDGVLATISRGAWHTFCIDLKLDENDGIFDLWIDGTQVINLRDSTLSPASENGTYWKQGLYRSTSETATNSYYYQDTVCWKNTSPTEMLEWYEFDTNTVYGSFSVSFALNITANAIGGTPTPPPPPPVSQGNFELRNISSIDQELYTLGRDFLKRDVIDAFESLIWTERYYGDGDVELVVPNTPDMISKLPVGTFISINQSSEIMIVETLKNEDGFLKASGTSILPWLNNRFIRASASHEDRYWYLSEHPAGRTLWDIVYNMCVIGSPYLDGTIDTGITNPERFGIPGLGLRDYDNSGENISVGVPYGPVYNALKEIATSFEIGMHILHDLEYPDPLGFRSYKGLDRTSGQTDNPVVRFSPHMDSFTDIKEVQSIAKFKTVVFAFAPGLTPAEGDPDLRTTPGISALTNPQYTGFDLRAEQIFAEDITTDMIEASSENLLNVLNSRAYDALTSNGFVQMVDGEIVPDNQFKYGVHYNLGDIIEVEGNSGVVKSARVTEYIRARDKSGEKAYPTVSVIE